MKYRIVQTGEGFIIQHKCLGLFWKNHKTPYYTLFTGDKNCGYMGNELVKFDSIERATEALKLIKSSPIKYNGHKIECSFQLGYVPFYVDMNSHCGYSSFCGQVSFDIPCFCRYSNNLENVKKAIDDYEMAQIKLKEDKLKKKQDKKIINVWYED